MNTVGIRCLYRDDKVLHKKEQDEREKVEQELLLMENKVKLLEDNLDRSEEQLAKTTQQLNAAETVRQPDFMHRYGQRLLNICNLFNSLHGNL